MKDADLREYRKKEHLLLTLLSAQIYTFMQ
jgi:hypothetical protein